MPSPPSKPASPVEKFDKTLRQLQFGTGALGKKSSLLATAIRDLDPVLLQQIKLTDNYEERLAILIRRMAGYETHAKRTAVAAAFAGTGNAGDFAAFAAQGEAAITPCETAPMKSAPSSHPNSSKKGQTCQPSWAKSARHSRSA